MLRNRFVVVLVLTAPGVWAYASGAGIRYSGAPGDYGDCSVCHKGSSVNNGGGSVSINLTGNIVYSPGLKQKITVKITDATQKRWGFEFAARLNSNLSNGQAGTLSATDSYARVTCETNPCSSSAIQFIMQTAYGTRSGTTNTMSYTFDWYPPQTDVGSIMLYVAAVAANADGGQSGDHVYTASLQLDIGNPWPVISSVTSASSSENGTAPGSWIAISGSFLSNTTRTWTPAEVAGKLPATLDGVSVKVNGKSAYVQSVSPGKVVALTPSDTATGQVEVVVTREGVAATMRTSMTTIAPGLLAAPDKRYVVVGHGDDPLAPRIDNMPSERPPTSGVMTGESVSFYGTGFGAVRPALNDGFLQDAPASLMTPFSLSIGGRPVPVTFGGLAQGFAGIYEFKTAIPGDLESGDYPVVIQMSNRSTQNGYFCCYVNVTAVPRPPMITSIVSAANQAPGTTPASWIAINGANLSNTTRAWTTDEATASTGLPTMLDGVSVLVNNTSAFVQAVSPTQLIVLLPSIDASTGQVDVQVTNGDLTSHPFGATIDSLAPALFTADGKYLVITHGTSALAERLDVYPASPAWPATTWPSPTPVQPGESITLYGAGFGPTDPPIVDGQLQPDSSALSGPYTVTIGGRQAEVSFAGLAPGFAGVYQFTAIVPPKLSDGTQAVVVAAGGVTTMATDKCCFVQVKAGSSLP